MKSKLLLDNPEWQACLKCGTPHPVSQDYCDKCSVPQSKPEFLAGIITITLAVVALYFVFQL